MSDLGDLGELGEITPCWTVTFRRTSRQPPARVWAALTEPDQIARWWRHPARVDLRVGGAYRVDFGDGGGLDGVIVRLQPERGLAYVWGRAVVEWTLEPAGAGCRYTFRHHGQEPAPEGAGWTDAGAGGRVPRRPGRPRAAARRRRGPGGAARPLGAARGPVPLADRGRAATGTGPRSPGRFGADLNSRLRAERARRGIRTPQRPLPGRPPPRG